MRQVSKKSLEFVKTNEGSIHYQVMKLKNKDAWSSMSEAKV